MSDATAVIHAQDGEVIGYTIYQGSACMIHPDFYSTEEEAHRWRHGAGPIGDVGDRILRCEHERVEAICVSHYGGESHWPVEVCVECSVIHGRLEDCMPDYGYRAPTPEEAAADQKWLDAGWPRNGDPFATEDVD